MLVQHFKRYELVNNLIHRQSTVSKASPPHPTLQALRISEQSQSTVSKASPARPTLQALRISEQPHP